MERPGIAFLFLMLLVAPAYALDCPKGLEFSFVSSADITDTAATTITGATGVAGKKYYITSWSISNTDATVGTRVDLFTGSTHRDSLPAASLFGGAVKPYPVPIVSGVNEAIKCQNATNSAEVRCSVQGCLLGQ